MTHRSRIRLVAAALTGLALLVGCDGREEKTQDPLKPPTAEQIADVEKTMKLKLPKNMKNASIDVATRGSEKQYLLRFELPAGEVDAFLKTSVFNGKKLSSEIRYARGNGGDKSWFDPDKAEKFRSATHEIKPGREEERILIDDTKGGDVTIYIHHSAQV